MAYKIIRINGVLERVPWGKSTIYQKIAEGKFPKPVSLGDGGRAVGWLESEIDEYVEARIAARDADADRAVDEEVDDSTSSSEAA